MNSKLDKNLKLYYVSSFIDGLLFTLPIWLIWFNKFLDLGTIGILSGLGFVFAIFLEVPTGAVADIIGRKKTVAFGKLGMAIGGLISSFATSPTHIVIALIIWNFFNPFISGSNTALIYDHLKSNGKENEFATVTSRATTIGRIAIIIGSFSGGFLYEIWNPLPYFLYAITSLVMAFLWMFIDEPTIDTEKFTWKGYLLMIKNGFKEIVKTSETLIVSFISIAVLSSGFLFREYFNYPFALDLGLDGKQQGILFGITAILKTITVIFAGKLINNHKRDRIIFYFLLIFAVVLLPTNWLGFAGGILIIILVEIITSLAPIISDTYTNQLFESKQRATASSFINMFSSAIYAVGIFGGVQLIEDIGSFRFYSIFGVGLVLVAMGFLVLRKKYLSKNT